MDSQIETIIVGGGMAGLATALFLRRSNKDVLVLEKSRAPRFKPCGGGITPRALLLAEKLGIDLGPLIHLKVMENNSPPWHYNRFEARLTVTGVADRQIIDQCVYDAAIAEGVRVVHAAVQRLDYHQGKFRVVTDKGVFQSRILVGADGANSLTRRAFGSHVPRIARAAMHRCIETSRYSDRIIFDGGYADRGYGWIFPTGTNTVNAGIYIIEKYSRDNLRQALNQYVRDRFGAKADPGPMTGGIIPWGGHTRPAKGVPVLLVGDAGGFADPLTGEGIYQALYTAKVAADAVISAEPSTVRRTYYRKLLPLRANVGMLRFACPIAHTPFGARTGGRVLGKSWVHGPVAEGLLMGLNTSFIGLAYPYLLQAYLKDSKLVSHKKRSYLSLAEHASKPF